MPDLDLAVRLRDYAREQETALVSSAWLADHFGVDPRTIAAALRSFGVRPGEVESGVRGYSVAELAGLVLPDEDEPTVEWAVPDVLAGRIPTESSALPDGWPGPGWHDLVDDQESDAIARLSAGAGHDMTPALRAAGLL